ncbi:hypothetical protein NDU88_004552 [Pleurodeles waltl]|uniref:Uncharacterized protein n=1 Tax=Pleurodeles waltl TaxID=8319 RepID=A0AAV7WYL9_PLEWA|nr:hypothetical protein NDU88_004552 [Pleurodeles waltl]
MRATWHTPLQRGPTGQRERCCRFSSAGARNWFLSAPAISRRPPDPGTQPPQPGEASGSRQDFTRDGSALEVRPVGHVPWPPPM